MKRSLYIAYGSNLNAEQMKRRCPDASIVGTTVLDGYELVFKSVATIKPKKNESVPVAIWSISERDEVSLDRYEGFPRFYYKEYFDIKLNGKTVNAMVYIMTEGTRDICPPSESYLKTIMSGYATFGFNQQILLAAEKKSHTPERYGELQVKKIRHTFGLTQKRMSEITGIPKSTIEAWDRGTRTPPEWLPKMIEAFLTLREFENGEEDRV